MKTRRLTQSSVLLALSILLPYLFHMTGVSGRVFLPMHIPVLLAGFLVGPIYAMLIGALAPVLNFFISQMPQMPFMALMLVELAVYGLLSGLLYRRFNTIITLIMAMIGGRIAYALAAWTAIKLFNISALPNPILMIKGSIVSGMPGILIQLIFIPTIVILLKKNLSYRDNLDIYNK